jgi:RNA polymerase sigma factor (sigma-70 family)
MLQIQGTTKIRGVDISDGMLARQSLGGDSIAFEQLTQRYSTPLFNFIYGMLGDYDLAWDVLQHVFLQLYTQLPTLHTDRPLKSWLFQVARNRSLDEVRRKRAIPFSQLEQGNDDDDTSLLAAIPDARPQPEEIVERGDLQQALLRAIEALPPKYRPIVMLRYRSDLTFTEIGRKLHMPEATAKTYFQRAKVLLRATLQNESRAAQA